MAFTNNIHGKNAKVLTNEGALPENYILDQRMNEEKGQMDIERNSSKKNGFIFFAEMP